MSMRNLICAISLLGLFLACQPETIYDVGTLKPQSDGEKTELKDDLQFMSIAYRDLFNEEVPPSTLEVMRTAYIGFGDKNLVVDRVVQAMLSSPNLVLPSQLDMLGDKELFINTTYRKFLLRDPTSFELAYWVSQLTEFPNLTPKDVYYIFMTSAEYKYY